MFINENISKIKSLMFESYGYAELDTSGHIDSNWGMRLRLNKKFDNVARVGIIDIGKAWNNDLVLQDLYNNFNDCKILNLPYNFIYENKSTYIFDLFVQESERRRGFAEKIMNFAHESAKKLDYKISTLIVETANEPAKKFYKKNNFETYLRSKKYELLIKEI
jgi:ribosomal protein S18 acetylase RimI-like enzyme